MSKKLHSYFITPFGVLSFTEKYVFVNGVKTKSTLKLIRIIQKLDPDLFSYSNLFVFGCHSYDNLKWTLLRYLRNGRYDLHITQISDIYCHKASEIFHGQYCVLNHCKRWK